jgi:dihydrofolate reductase
MIKMIAACTTHGVIGVDGKIPFDYSADMKHFKALTLNSTVVMGRKTFEGIGKPLPKRRNIVISSNKIQDMETYSSLLDLIYHLDCNAEIWLIGGSAIYQEGMKYAQEIHLTITPDEENHPNSVKFPWIDPTIFKLDSWEYMAADPRLKYCIYKRQ